MCLCFISLALVFFFFFIVKLVMMSSLGKCDKNTNFAS